MRTPLLAAALLAMPLTACVSDGDGSRYGYDRPGYGQRPGGRPIGENDYIYRDNDGRYYCKRDDGTTGTIVGAIAGGGLGTIIAPGGSKTLGTIIGGHGGALPRPAAAQKDVPRPQ